METAIKPSGIRFYLPFLLSIAIIVADQLTKFIIVQTIPFRTIGHEFFGDFLRIIHTRNLGIAFSIGYGWPDVLRKLLFIILPLGAIAIGIWYFIVSPEVTRSQQWCIAGIIGGGSGNLVDRVFRPLGVVDWVDVKFYGLFGMERWPTFNIADASIVISGILLAIVFIIEEKRHSGSRKNEQDA